MSAENVQEAPTAGIEQQLKDITGRLEKLEEKGKNLTIVLMSGDFDKVFGAFIIANGALAMDMNVTIFATFWGLDAIKKVGADHSGKNLLESMVHMMRPSGPQTLPTSKMNFGGIGPKLFHYMMAKKNIESLPSLIEIAREFGIRIIGCQMSMDVMGIKKEELLDGVEVGGVAAMMASANKSNTTLFI